MCNGATDGDDSPEAFSELISPELVLVSPDLRAVAMARLSSRDYVFRHDDAADLQPAAPGSCVHFVGSADGRAGDADSARLLPQMMLYAGWQALVGALFGIAAFGALIALIVATALLR
jgi:hypothetical protein